MQPCAATSLATRTGALSAFVCVHCGRSEISPLRPPPEGLLKPVNMRLFHGHSIQQGRPVAGRCLGTQEAQRPAPWESGTSLPPGPGDLPRQGSPRSLGGPVLALRSPVSVCRAPPRSPIPAHWPLLPQPAHVWPWLPAQTQLAPFFIPSWEVSHPWGQAPVPLGPRMTFTVSHGLQSARKCTGLPLWICLYLP